MGLVSNRNGAAIMLVHLASRSASRDAHNERSVAMSVLNGQSEAAGIRNLMDGELDRVAGGGGCGDDNLSIGLGLGLNVHGLVGTVDGVVCGVDKLVGSVLGCI
jgi:hypothetical protein